MHYFKHSLKFQGLIFKKKLVFTNMKSYRPFSLYSIWYSLCLVRLPHLGKKVPRKDDYALAIMELLIYSMGLSIATELVQRNST